VAHGEHGGHESSLVGDGDVGSCGEEAIDHGVVPVARCQVEGRLAGGVLPVDIESLLDEEADDLGVAVLCCQVEQGVSIGEGALGKGRGLEVGGLRQCREEAPGLLQIAGADGGDEGVPGRCW
jgi:hypothetical protein